MRAKPMHLSLVAEPKSFALKKTHLDILRYLRDMGAENAGLWREDDVDELFKHRPRYVALVKGNEHPVIEITREGLLALTKHEEGSNGHRKDD
jgi:hypothetical protein